jgi:putative glycosyltransferase
MKISVVTPLYRSAPYIDELYRRTIAVIGEIGADAYEIIFVNDHSPDESLDVALAIARDDENTVVIDLSRNFGQHHAVMTGLAQATGDYVFIMDSDLEEDPEWIGLFFREMQKQQCDVVYGINNNAKGGRLYMLARSFYYKILNFLSPIEFPANVCAARLMSRRYVEALLQFKERELFMAGIWHMAGFSQLAVQVVKRDASPTTYSFRGRANLFLNAVTAFSTRPLVMIFALGILLSLVALAFVCFVVFRKLIYGVQIEGWSSVMAAVLLIGGISIFFNGVIAIYIAKIFIEVKQRPRSIIRQVYRTEAGGENLRPAKTLQPPPVVRADGHGS